MKFRDKMFRNMWKARFVFSMKDRKRLETWRKITPNNVVTLLPPEF